MKFVLVVCLAIAYQIVAGAIPREAPHKDDRCPAVDPPEPVYIPDEDDCRYYYECSNGYIWRLFCTGGTVFNPEKNVCDFPQNVDCKNTKAKVSLVKDYGMVKVGNNTEPPHKDDRCPAVDPPTPVYIPNEKDCSKYYECNGGYIYEFSCPGDLLFNPDLLVCDFPKNVNCAN